MWPNVETWRGTHLPLPLVAHPTGVRHQQRKPHADQQRVDGTTHGVQEALPRGLEPGIAANQGRLPRRGLRPVLDEAGENFQGFPLAGGVFRPLHLGHSQGKTLVDDGINLDLSQ